MCALAANHRIIISLTLRTLKRSLRSQHLFRRKYHTDVLDIARFVSDQLRESGGLHGYRWMHLKCRQAGFVTTRQVVYTIMQILDKDGVELRRKGRLKRRKYFAKGPNYLWHLDAYDKLKPYGLCISGCIDGFSRQLIWLNVYRTSSNPRVIAGYYIEAVDQLVGCPSMVRGDMGTENGHVAGMQIEILDWATEQFPVRKEHTQSKNRKFLVHSTERMQPVLDGHIKRIERRRSFHR